MLAIAKKDIQSQFHSFTGWLFIAVVWLFLSLYVNVGGLIGLNPAMTNSVTIVEIVYLFAIPILTMRLLAGERRQKTDQMILTAPISVGKVVMGKFLGAAGILAIPVAGLCVYPLIFRLFGKVPFAENYLAILAVFLLGLAEIAICLFASSLTENPIIAAVISFAILMVSILVPTIEGVFSSNTVLTSVLDWVDLSGKFEKLTGGSLDVPTLVYFVMVIVLFLFLTTQSIQKRRYTVSAKNLSMGAYSTGMIAVMIAITVVVNLAAAQIPTKYSSADLTGNAVTSLSSSTTKVLDQLKESDQTVTIYVLQAKKSVDDEVARLLSLYTDESKKVKVVYKDPTVDPTFAAQYTSATQVTKGSMIVVCGDRSKFVDYNDIYQYDVDYQTYSQTVSGFDGEGQLTSAIAYVTSENNPVVYTLTNHSETTLGSSFTDALKKLNYDVRSLDLLRQTSVPEDADAIIICGAQKDLSDAEYKALASYIKKGGDLIVSLDFQMKGEMTNLKKLLKLYGVGYEDGVALDSDSNHYYQYQSYLLPVVGSDTITSEVTGGNGYVFAPYSMAITTAETKNVTFTTLLSTSSQGYVHNDVTSETTDFQQKDSDQTGTLNLGVKAEKKISKKVTSQLVVFGSTLMLSDGADQMVQGSNDALFASAVTAQIDNADTSAQVNIPAVSYSSSTLTVSAGKAMLIIALTTAAVPIVLLISGFAMWLVRRRR